MPILSQVTEILLPNSDGTNTGWGTDTGACWSDVDANDASSCRSDTVGQHFTVRFPDLSVSADDINGGLVDSISAYTWLFLDSPDRAHAVDIKQQLYWNDGGSLTEVGGITHSGVIAKYQTQVWPITSESNADPSKINDYEIKTTYMTQNAAGLMARIIHIYLVVKYTPKVATYNSNVNNVHISSGNTNISSGNIFI